MYIEIRWACQIPIFAKNWPFGQPGQFKNLQFPSRSLFFSSFFILAINNHYHKSKKNINYFKLFHLVPPATVHQWEKNRVLVCSNSSLSRLQDKLFEGAPEYKKILVGKPTLKFLLYVLFGKFHLISNTYTDLMIPLFLLLNT